MKGSDLFHAENPSLLKKRVHFDFPEAKKYIERLPKKSSFIPEHITGGAVLDWLPRLHGEGLVDAVDAFCEGIGFSPAQTRRVFEATRGLGLPVKLHADQLSDLDGAALVAEFGGLSADHIEHTSEAGVFAMRDAGTVAVLLPGAFHALRETRLPPLDLLRAHGVPMAVATDCNPGTSPLLSLRQAMQLACTHFRLTRKKPCAERPCMPRARSGCMIAACCASGCVRTSCAGMSGYRPNSVTGWADNWRLRCMPAASA